MIWLIWLLAVVALIVGWDQTHDLLWWLLLFFLVVSVWTTTEINKAIVAHEHFGDPLEDMANLARDQATGELHGLILSMLGIPSKYIEGYQAARDLNDRTEMGLGSRMLINVLWALILAALSISLVITWW